MEMSFYDVLRVPTDADQQALREAWLRARESAPASGFAWILAWFEGRTRADVDEAYAVLSDPANRAWHDYQCAVSERINAYPGCH